MLPSRIPWRHLLSVTALYLAVAGCWLVAIPPFEGPDELQHYDYARYVAFTGHLPDHIPSTLNEGGWFTVQWVQEGAYYLTFGQMLRAAGAAAAPPQFTQDPASRWNGGVGANLLQHARPMPPALARGLMVGRVSNLLVGLGTLLCVFGAVHAYTRRPRLAALAAASLALIPEFGVHHVLVSNDPPAAFLASLASLLLVQWYMKGAETGTPDSWRIPAAIGAVSGLAVVTKLTAGFLLVMGPMLFWMKRRLDDAERLNKARGARWWQWAVAWGVALLAASGWNFVRNWQVFGDPLATALKQTLVAQHGNPIHFHPGELSSYRNLLHVLFHGFWVSIGWTDWGPEAIWVWLLYGAMTIVLLLAVVAAIAAARSDEITPRSRGLVGVLLVTIVLHTVAFAIALAHTPGYSMRYFLPLTVPLAIVVTAGFEWLHTRAARRIGAGALQWMLASLIVALALAWLATFGEAVLAFRFGGRFDAMR